MANGDVYPTDLDKVLFVISYMNEGDANSWKEEFFDTAEQAAAQTLGAKIDLGTYDNLIKKIVEDFSPYDAPKDAIYEMKELKMGNSSIEEHVSKFKMLVTKSKLAKNDAVAEYFRESLPIALQKNILSLPEQPKSLEEWYRAVKLQNNYIHMRSAISKTQNRGGSTTSNNNNNKTNEKGTRRFYFEQPQKDPNAMDVDFMSTEERETLLRKGACFGCKQIGHLSRDCPNKKRRFIPSQTPNTQQKMKGKELHAHVRSLLAQMEEKDKEEFFDDAAKEGF